MGGNGSDKGERVYRRIVVPLDGSEAAEAVLELAKNLAVRSGAALMLLHVCRPEEAGHERIHSAYIQRVADLVERDISKICETVQCHFEGVTATEVDIGETSIVSLHQVWAMPAGMFTGAEQHWLTAGVAQ